MKKNISAIVFLLFSFVLPCSVFSAVPTENQKLASAFLLRTTFGPTMDEINQLANQISAVGPVPAFSDWIDKQLLIPASSHKRMVRQMEMDDREFYNWSPGLDVNQFRYRDYAWWNIAVTSPDQLRQRMAWALSQIFVVSTVGNSIFNNDTNDASGMARSLGMVDYYDQMVNGSFGNYRDLIEDVSLHPVMGRYLSHVKNPKGDGVTIFPDENYARELMQLFSIGLNELNLDGTWKLSNGEPIPTYDNDTIKSFARVFTGLLYEHNKTTGTTQNDFNNSSINFNQPMIMFEGEHDTGEKILLNNVTLPPNQTGMQDISGALDNLFNHENVGPFIGRQLIQRFVMSNPSKEYIQSVSEAFNNNGNNIRGDFSAVLKAVLLHSEAIGSLGIRDTESSRLREPVLRYASLIRSFAPVSNYHTGRIMLTSPGDFSQRPYSAPHVFNYYLPDYQPPGEILDSSPTASIPNGKLVAPEYEILNAVTANKLANLVRQKTIGAGANIPHGYINNTLIGNTSYTSAIVSRTELDHSYENSIAVNAVDLVDTLDLLLCGGGLSNDTKATVSSALDQFMLPVTSDAKSSKRVKVAIIGVAMSPDCAVQ